MSNITYHGNVAFGHGSGAAFAFGKNKNSEKHTIVNPEDKTSGEIAKWGDDNQYPQNFLKALNLNGAGGAALRILKSTHYGQGFHLFTEEVTEDGKHEKKIVSLKENKDMTASFSRGLSESLFSYQNDEEFSKAISKNIKMICEASST